MPTVLFGGQFPGKNGVMQIGMMMQVSALIKVIIPI